MSRVKLYFFLSSQLNHLLIGINCYNIKSFLKQFKLSQFEKDNKTMQRSFKIILYYVHLLGASEQHVAVISKKVLIMYNESVSVSSNLFRLSICLRGYIE